MADFWYLATPYSKYEGGIWLAQMEACRAAAYVIQQQNRSVYSPIAHSHYIAIHGKIDPLDHSLWMAQCKPMMDAACGLIVVKMQGWQESVGIRQEIAAFEAAGKPVEYLDWPLG